MQRRFAWRNERTLFRNKCAATGKAVISCFAPDSGITVYDRDYWWSDAWDPLAFGADYDFSRPFFGQFAELLKKVPMPAVFNARTVNSSYVNYVGEYKDAYLVSASWDGENVCYASRCNASKDIVDAFAINNCSLCSYDVGSSKLFNVHFSSESEGCADSWFLFGCKGCTDCFGCTNLRNKSYCFFNEQLSREEYGKRVAAIDLGSFRQLEETKKKFEVLKLGAIRKYATFVSCNNVTGDRLYNVADSRFCFDSYGNVKDCKYLTNALSATDTYDGYGVGGNCELLYEGFDSGVEASRQYFVGSVYGTNDARYALNCHGSSNLFGCIGLRNREYCVLNKQYSKEEYKTLIPKIIEQMGKVPYVDGRGRTYGYGEFFPTELSPFAYNETVANDYFPLTRERASESGFAWREADAPRHTITKKAGELPDDIKETPDSITREIIECSSCGKPYQIIGKEYDFLKKINAALPRKCFECRHGERFRSVNPPKLYHRSCMCDKKTHFHGEGRCSNEFETSYAPERKEVIYCEQCFNAEIV
jgi:hypothetical protein